LRYREAAAYVDNAEYRERFAVKGNAEFFNSPPHGVSVLFERPNKFRILRQVPETSSPGLVVDTASDGTTQRATISDLPTQFLEQPVPATIALDTVARDPVLAEQLFAAANLYPQLDLLLCDGTRSDALAGTSYRYLDDLPLESGDCWRVAIARSDGQRVAWIDKSSGLLRRLEFASDQARKIVDPDGNFSRYELWIDFLEASTDAVGAKQAFVLAPKPNMRVVSQFTPQQPAATASEAVE
jgi:hypothetical protein